MTAEVNGAADKMADLSVAGAEFWWKEKKPMHSKRVFCSAVEIDNVLYVVGGCGPTGQPIDILEKYTPTKMQPGEWAKLRPMLTKRAQPCVVAVGRELLAFGGVGHDQEPVSNLEIYNVDTRKWRSASDMKEKMMGVSAVIRDGRVILVGGMGADTNPKDYLMSYDLSTDLWEAMTPMPTARYASFSFLINDRLYVLGGRQGKTPVPACEVYDFATSQWRQLPPIPSKRIFALYVASDTHIFSLGGLNEDVQKGFSDACEIFDVKTETWRTGSAMPTKRGDMAATYFGGRVTVSGGLGNEGRPLDVCESYDVTTDTWRGEEKMAAPHCSCASVMFQGRMHVLGGLSEGGATAKMEVLSYAPRSDDF